MSIVNQIQRIKTNITNAYNEIEKFNVNVTEYNNKSDKLAEAIAKIEVGDTSSQTTDMSLSPANINGLTFWMDSQCNTRNGFDTTKSYLENLVAMSTSTGALSTEYWKSTTANTFDEDGLLALDTYCRLPYQISGFNGTKCFTIEAVFKRTGYNENTQQIFHCANNGGFSVGVLPSGEIYTQCYNGTSGGSSVYVSLGLNDASTSIEGVPYSTNFNQIYYLTVVADETTFNLYVNNSLVQKISRTASKYTYATSSVGTIYAGIGTKAYTSTNLNLNGYTGLSLGMVRMWCRPLSEEERTQRFEECKKRFNIPDDEPSVAMGTLTINPTPTDATVILTADGFEQEGNSITVEVGTEVTYSVYCEDYVTQNDTVIVDEDINLSVTLTLDDSGSDWGSNEPFNPYG